ncbi:MAG TPA: CPBP family intramembrane glutamic endopeptidase [Planctomycetota bacterium]|nr:CPBP family intramembrane glutamic endopeptidase [Planctomycetota bacterium]
MARPDAVDAARVLALGLLAMALAALLAGAGLSADLATAVQQAAFFAIPLIYARATGLRPWADNGFRRIDPVRLAAVVLASLALLWILKGLVDLQEEAFRALGLGERVEVERRRIEHGVERAGARGTVYAAALFVAASPLSEETLFRGILLRGLTVRFGAVRAVALTAAAFAAAHWKLVQVPPMLLLGLYFGTVVRLTGSLWAGIVAHAINNAAVLVLTLRYGADLPALPTPAGMVGAAVVVFALCLAFLAVRRADGEA